MRLKFLPLLRWQQLPNPGFYPSLRAQHGGLKPAAAQISFECGPLGTPSAKNADRRYSFLRVPKPF